MQVSYPTLNVTNLKRLNPTVALGSAQLPLLQRAQQEVTSASPSKEKRTGEKLTLQVWWQSLKRSEKARLRASIHQQAHIFGVPLEMSFEYAKTTVSFHNQGRGLYRSSLPRIVVKCDDYLRERGTDVERIFERTGSPKRIGELHMVYDSPPLYGATFSWEGYTAFDVASLLLRYLLWLPEPIIPHTFYDRFQQPLQQSRSEPLNANAAATDYKLLLTELPQLRYHLLLYLLDLLAVFASKSDLNLMTTFKLAALFHPAILDHPDHRLSPTQMRKNQDMVIFLIENLDQLCKNVGTDEDEGMVYYGDPSISDPSEYYIDAYPRWGKTSQSSMFRTPNLLRRSRVRE